MAHRTERRVQLQEVDAAGVVFFGHFFVMAHQAYEAAFLASGFDLACLLAAGRQALPMVHAEADYRNSLRYGDTVAIDTTCTRIGDRSFTLEFGFSNPATAVDLARLVHIHACLDVAGGRSAALPTELTAALGRLRPAA